MTPKTIACPRCQQTASLEKNNQFRPFCSQRCKDGDFIGWSEEDNRIPVAPDISDLMSGELDPF